MTKTTRLDITGQRYGRLVALEYAGRRIGNNGAQQTLWKFRCDCGNFVVRKLAHVRCGYTNSCGCLYKELQRKGRKRLKEGESSFNGLFSHYKQSARERKYEWNLTRDRFRELVTGACHYCGCLSSTEYRTNVSSNGTFRYSGIDRVDNNIGYIEGNVVSCCKQCNRAKGSLSVEEFFDWMNRLFVYQEKKDVQI